MISGSPLHTPTSIHPPLPSPSPPTQATQPLTSDAALPPHSLSSQDEARHPQPSAPTAQEIEETNGHLYEVLPDLTPGGRNPQRVTVEFHPQSDFVRCMLRPSGDMVPCDMQTAGVCMHQARPGSGTAGLVRCNMYSPDELVECNMQSAGVCTHPPLELVPASRPLASIIDVHRRQTAQGRASPPQQPAQPTRPLSAGEMVRELTHTVHMPDIHAHPGTHEALAMTTSQPMLPQRPMSSTYDALAPTASMPRRPASALDSHPMQSDHYATRSEGYATLPSLKVDNKRPAPVPPIAIHPNRRPLFVDQRAELSLGDEIVSYLETFI